MHGEQHSDRGEAGRLILGVVTINVILPIILSFGLQNLPAGTPFMPVFWMAVGLILVLNVLLARTLPQLWMFVALIAGLNLIATVLMGAIAFLPKSYVMLQFLMSTPT